MFEWESDYFSISKSNYSYEVEIKISRSDFKKDFEKSEKHQMLSCIGKEFVVVNRGMGKGGLSHIEEYKEAINRWNPNNIVTKKRHVYFDICRVQTSKIGRLTPNRFYYACPEGLIQKEEIPVYAGLIWTADDGTVLRVVKESPFIHKQKFERWEYLANKMFHQHRSMRHNVNIASYEKDNNSEKLKNLIGESQDNRILYEIEKDDGRLLIISVPDFIAVNVLSTFLDIGLRFRKLKEIVEGRDFVKVKSIYEFDNLIKILKPDYIFS